MSCMYTARVIIGAWWTEQATIYFVGCFVGVGPLFAACGRSSDSQTWSVRRFGSSTFLRWQVIVSFPTVTRLFTWYKQHQFFWFAEMLRF